jgi:aquaporin Z
MLVLVAAGGALLHSKGQISLSAAVVAPGLMVMAIILFMGAVSGAHLNPVVSVAFASRGDFPWKRVPGYIGMQLLGATLACVFLLIVFGNVEHLGATLPGPGYKAWQAFMMEIALTATLVSVILGTASSAQNVGTIGALGVGGYVALAGLWAAPVSGASMNPARSFGPALVAGDWTAYWVYVAGPLIGAAIAVGCAVILRGRGGDRAARTAASGALASEPDKRPPRW